MPEEATELRTRLANIIKGVEMVKGEANQLGIASGLLSEIPTIDPRAILDTNNNNHNNNKKKPVGDARIQQLETILSELKEAEFEKPI